MDKRQIKDMAEAHWDYTSCVIQKSNPTLDDDMIELCRYLYVESFIHGFKHCRQDDEIYEPDTRWPALNRFHIKEQVKDMAAGKAMSVGDIVDAVCDMLDNGDGK